MQEKIGAAAAILALAAFAACSDAPQPSFAPQSASPLVRPVGSQRATGGHQRRLPPSMEAVLHSFAGSPADGLNPWAGLTEVNGTLYGTTTGGGSSGNGTVFTITTSGTETVLYNFAGGTDGATPYAGLVNVGNALYGTTAFGGTSNNGTIFKITKSGVERVLYRFAGGTDGANPYATLTNVNGTLYGTTDHGGVSGNGTIFSVTTSGSYNQLHSFAGSPADGANSYGALTNVSGTLYGATIDGGSSNNGTIFKVTTAGAENVIYSFAGGADGAELWDGLTKVGQKLYGTTALGGTSGNGTSLESRPQA